VPECNKYVTDWVEEMAAHMKSLAPNHLITTGGEGFFSEDSERR
jgi:endo-1,4-beta-mannosidase